MAQLEEECKPHCVKALLAYQACQERIAGDTTGEAHCTGQYFDYWQCIDHCVRSPLPHPHLHTRRSPANSQLRRGCRTDALRHRISQVAPNLFKHTK